MTKSGELGGRPGRACPPFAVAIVVLAALALVVVAVLVSRRPTPPGDEPRPEPAVAQDTAKTPGRVLYERHCAACHGDKGQGDGPAARLLYPKPRDFTEAKFRIVTTASGLPADDDLRHVIRDGMPGSAMIPFGHLGDDNVMALVAEVRHLIHSGIEAILRQAAAEAREDDEEVLATRRARLTAVGKPIEIPALPAPAPESVARGAKLFKDRGCASCHGETGKGDGVQAQRNDDGMPTRPRDLTLGIFKGGIDSRQLYARLVRGMPGSPMPGSDGLSPEQTGDLINFAVALSTPEMRARFVHKRMKVTARRVAEVSDEMPETVWDKAEAVPVVVSPLWWREYPDPALRATAVHDGRALAVRLTWADPTRNDRVLSAEDFEDMAAVQLFKGEAEPFLGMGAAGAGLDLWLWRATWHRQGAESESLLDDYPFDMPIYRELTKGQSARPPDFLTARAAGNPHAHADRGASAASLTANGFGSTTFRPKTSQSVTARSAHADGRWSVVLRRPLSVPADDGLSLAPGQRCSVAFALWDGAARDRNGQKLVSIWHDVTIEE